MKHLLLISLLLPSSLASTASAWAQGVGKPKPSESASPQTYYVDCRSASGDAAGTTQSPFAALAKVNALQLRPGDSLLFKRGSTCDGSLHPQGSGDATAALHIAAYGQGPLPRIVAGTAEKAALRLTDQQYWEVESLDLSGGNTFGIVVESTTATLHHLVLRDLRVHDVRGPLKQKDTGLVVIHNTTEHGAFDDVLLDGIHAFNTSQWSGILVIGASNVRIRNSVAHDVQGDGIVVFHSQNVLIARSLAWHTGMQHQQSIGTPNAIWTWQCTDCIVEENEAFLSDSPGVDGGAFDIDFGNTRNTVRRNFGHDTAGYCVSIFGAYGPTTQSVVADNLCMNNGMSPRLAQRQGAILLMTWQGGSIDNVDIHGNHVDWQPSGDTPAIQSGSALQASGVTIRDNALWSSGISFVDPTLKYDGRHNRYATALRADFAEAQRRVALLPERDSALTQSNDPMNGVASKANAGDARSWQLNATLPSEADPQTTRATLVLLESAALQFGRAGLTITIACDKSVAALARDAALSEIGVSVQPLSTVAAPRYSVRLLAPDGTLVREWATYPGPIELGLALRQNVGPPNFSALPFEEIRATD